MPCCQPKVFRKNADKDYVKFRGVSLLWFLKKLPSKETPLLVQGKENVMIYENTLVLYSPDKGDEFLRSEKEEEQKFHKLISTLRSLREFDPEGYEELEQAMRHLRGEISLYSVNVFAEYGLLENPVIKGIIERQERVMAIVRSNKDIETLNQAMKSIAA